MNLAYWCVFVSGLLPVLTVAVAKYARGYDNANPRAWLERQEGYRRRADYAHRNHFEAFPFFAAAVIIAQLQQAPQAAIDTLALTFVVARLIYTFAYLFDYALLRSLAFVAGYASIIGLFLQAARLV